MSGPIEEFFDALDGSDQRAAFMGRSGSLRFDLRDDDGRMRRWLVRSDKGRLSVTRSESEADCVIDASIHDFAEVVTGRANPMAALLRGTVSVEGRAALLAAFQKLFPGPPQQEPDRGVAGYARRPS